MPPCQGRRPGDCRRLGAGLPGPRLRCRGAPRGRRQHLSLQRGVTEPPRVLDLQPPRPRAGQPPRRAGPRAGREPPRPGRAGRDCARIQGPPPAPAPDPPRSCPCRAPAAGSRASRPRHRPALRPGGLGCRLERRRAAGRAARAAAGGRALGRPYRVRMPPRVAAKPVAAPPPCAICASPPAPRSPALPLRPQRRSPRFSPRARLTARRASPGFSAPSSKCATRAPCAKRARPLPWMRAPWGASPPTRRARPLRNSETPEAFSAFEKRRGEHADALSNYMNGVRVGSQPDNMALLQRALARAQHRFAVLALRPDEIKSVEPRHMARAPLLAPLRRCLALAAAERPGGAKELLESFAKSSHWAVPLAAANQAMLRARDQKEVAILNEVLRRAGGGRRSSPPSPRTPTTATASPPSRGSPASRAVGCAWSRTSKPPGC